MKKRYSICEINPNSTILSLPVPIPAQDLSRNLDLYIRRRKNMLALRGEKRSLRNFAFYKLAVAEAE
jgi:hypothetical protein